ncbi:MAG: hypothetical protein EAZ89_03655 [Bacteroidetes bacterium]|nr:MAG: hypothetical protein EAZ89_03655 [Bacteroidota bacterium]
MKSSFDSVHIRLESAGETVLSLMMNRGGALNRMGDGTGEAERSRLCMGRSEEPLFEQWLELMDENLLELAGRYTFPDPQGELCVLSIELESEAGNTGFEFTYGTDSQGPPEEITALVDAALDLSDPWYEAQLNKKGKQKR